MYFSMRMSNINVETNSFGGADENPRRTKPLENIPAKPLENKQEKKIVSINKVCHWKLCLE